MIVGAHLAYMGQADEALAEIDAAMRFNPLYPALYLIHRARALFVARRFQEALSDIQRATVTFPEHPNALALLAACYAVLDRKNGARDAVRDLRDASPVYTVGFARRTLPFANSADLDLFCELLTKAGLPD